MSFGWAAATIIIPTVVCGIGVVLLGLAGRCDHTMYPNIHVDTGRIFYVCRCGSRFQR